MGNGFGMLHPVAAWFFSRAAWYLPFTAVIEKASTSTVSGDALSFSFGLDDLIVAGRSGSLFTPLVILGKITGRERQLVLGMARVPGIADR